MNRRQALSLTATIMGGTIVGSNAILSGCNFSEERTMTGLFSTKDLRLLDEIGEAILPHSEKSPGAKAANIGEFMKTIVTDLYSDEEIEIFKSGLKEIQHLSDQNYSQDFLDITIVDRQKLLLGLDKVARSGLHKEKVHYYTMIKQLTIWGYFTSEPGATKALRYNPVPGRFEGCIDYKPGDKAWV